MPLLLLFLLMIAFIWEDLPVREDTASNAWMAPSWCQGEPTLHQILLFVVLTWAGFVLLVAAAAHIAHWTRQQLYFFPGQREQILRRYWNWRLYHLLGLYAFYLLSLFVLGYGWAIAGLRPLVMPGHGPGMLPFTELLLIVPLLTALVGSWAFFYTA